MPRPRRWKRWDDTHWRVHFLVRPRLLALPLCIIVIIISGCTRPGSRSRRSTPCGLWTRRVELLYHGCRATIGNFDSWWRCCQRRCYANHGWFLPLGGWSRGWNCLRRVTAKWPIRKQFDNVVMMSLFSDLFRCHVHRIGNFPVGIIHQEMSHGLYAAFTTTQEQRSLTLEMD